MDKLRIVRDSIDRGDRVLVHRHGPVPRAARVAEVMRSCVRVVYDDAPGHPYTVHFKDITTCEDAPPTATPPATSPPVTVRRRRTDPVVEAAAPPPPRAPEPADDTTAWLAMGVDIAAKLEEEIKLADARVEALRDDAAKLLARATEDAAKLTAAADEVRRSNEAKVERLLRIRTVIG